MTLDARLKALARAAAVDALPDATLDDKGLAISAIGEEERDRINALSRRLYTLVPRVGITSLLAEVHRWTGFLDSSDRVANRSGWQSAGRSFSRCQTSKQTRYWSYRRNANGSALQVGFPKRTV